jgi:hypothetical protein
MSMLCRYSRVKVVLKQLIVLKGFVGFVFFKSKVRIFQPQTVVLWVISGRSLTLICVVVELLCSYCSTMSLKLFTLIPTDYYKPL